jgi:L-malate glycosyltransferase
MKVLFYNHTGKVSGAEHLMLMILSQLDSGFDPTVICPATESLRQMVTELGVPVETVAGLAARFTWRPDYLPRYLNSFLRVIVQVRRKVVALKPGVVHANSIRSGLVATAATVGLGTRIVWHLHDLLPRHPLSSVIRILASLSRRSEMIAVSQSVAANFCGASVPLRKKVRVILNAIDLKKFHPTPQTRTEMRRELKLSNDQCVVGIVGQVTPRKGQLELVRAFAQSLRNVPDAVLLIVGAPLFNRDPEYLELIKQTALDLGIAGRVRMLGPRSDVAAIMQSLDLLVVNSSAEPFGLVAPEAMACRIPVLATATGGLAEIIEHGKDGWLVPPRDQVELAAAIVTLCNQPALRAQLAKAAAEKVAASFSSERYLAELREFYREAPSIRSISIAGCESGRGRHSDRRSNATGAEVAR